MITMRHRSSWSALLCLYFIMQRAFGQDGLLLFSPPCICMEKWCSKRCKNGAIYTYMYRCLWKGKFVKNWKKEKEKESSPGGGGMASAGRGNTRPRAPPGPLVCFEKNEKHCPADHDCACVVVICWAVAPIGSRICKIRMEFAADIAGLARLTLPRGVWYNDRSK